MMYKTIPQMGQRIIDDIQEFERSFYYGFSPLRIIVGRYNKSAKKLSPDRGIYDVLDWLRNQDLASVYYTLHSQKKYLVLHSYAKECKENGVAVTAQLLNYEESVRDWLKMDPPERAKTYSDYEEGGN